MSGSEGESITYYYIIILLYYHITYYYIMYCNNTGAWWRGNTDAEEVVTCNQNFKRSTPVRLPPPHPLFVQRQANSALVRGAKKNIVAVAASLDLGSGSSSQPRPW